MWSYHPDLLAKPVPRYTSYPTAMEFTDAIGADDYAHALDGVESATPISVYVHIPFCEQICWYCGCNTGATSRKQRLADYLIALQSEIAFVAKLLGGRGRVQHIAFGGGSPNAIAPIELVRLLDRILTVFDAHRPEVSVELDPRGFTAEWALVLAAANVTRVSLGVQTFAPHVQQAIGRVQPLSHIERVVAALRLRDIGAINFDLMYGLPGQTMDDLDATLADTIRLAPSRIALFGYPTRSLHGLQALIEGEADERRNCPPGCERGGSRHVCIELFSNSRHQSRTAAGPRVWNKLSGWHVDSDQRDCAKYYW